MDILPLLTSTEVEYENSSTGLSNRSKIWLSFLFLSQDVLSDTETSIWHSIYHEMYTVLL